MEQLEEAGISPLDFTKDTPGKSASEEKIQENRAVQQEGEPKSGAAWQEGEPKNGAARQEETAETIARLQRELEAEKSARLEAEKRAGALSQRKELLEKDLETVKKRLEEEKAKVSRMLPELDRLQMLSKHADTEPADSDREFQRTSLCQVFTDSYGKRCRRLADIKEGRVVPFSKTEGEPPYFGNRDKLPLFNGPDRDDFVGIWDWSSLQNLKDSRKDFIKMQYNDSVKWVEVVELPDCHSCEDIARYLAANLLPGLESGKVFFACGEGEGRMGGLLCTKEDFVQEESSPESARLKKEICSLPRYTVDARDILDFSGMKIYRYLSMGVPQGMFQVRSTLKAVKDIILARATGSRFRQEGLTRKETQHCQAFLKELPGETLCQEIARAYGCTEQEAEEYLSAFVDQADAYLEEKDMELGILGAAVGRSGKFAEQCKALLREECRAEAAGELGLAREELEQVRKAAEEERLLLGQLEERRRTLQTQTEEKEALAREVEEKIAARMAAAKKDAADFISQMAFVLPGYGPEEPGKPEKVIPSFSVTRGKKDSLSGENIAEVTSFEKELADNLRLAGYEDSTALEMAGRIVFALDSRRPLVCKANGESIARCLSAMFGGKGAYHLTLPAGEDRCREVCDFIRGEAEDRGRGVFLVNGMFDGSGFRAFHEICQRSEEWGTDGVLLFPLSGADPESVPGYVWNRVVFLDGDTGLAEFEAEKFHAHACDVDFCREYDGELFRQKRELLRRYRGLADNRALLEYAKYLAVTGKNVEAGGMVLTQIILSARSSGKREDLLETLLSAGFDIKSDEGITRYL